MIFSSEMVYDKKIRKIKLVEVVAVVVAVE